MIISNDARKFRSSSARRIAGVRGGVRTEQVAEVWQDDELISTWNFNFGPKYITSLQTTERVKSHAEQIAKLNVRAGRKASSSFESGSDPLFAVQSSRSSPESLEDSQKMESQALRRRVVSFLKSSGLEGAESKDRLDRAVRDALVFILMAPKRLPLPNASSYSDDGEVVLRWSSGEKKAEVAFLGDDVVEYTYRDNGRYVPGREEGRPTEWPSDLQDYFVA